MALSESRLLCGIALLVLLIGGACSAGEARHAGHSGDRGEERGEKHRDSGEQHRDKGPLFFAAIERTVQGCGTEAAELKNMRPQIVVQSLMLRDDQLKALDNVRTSANTAGGVLEGACPRKTPGTLSGKLDSLDTALRLVVDALNSVRPALVTFFDSLDDEQKVRFALITLLDAAPASSDERAKQRASDNNSKGNAKSLCPEWAADLRSFPVGQIESGMQLSDTQHAAFYELAAAIYRSAGDLDQACPVEGRVTPLGRLDARKDELLALRDDINAIRPFATAFENALNPTQKNQLAEAATR